MPTIISSTSFSTAFRFNTTPKTFLFTDTTDLTGPAIPASGVKDVFTIVDPYGNTIYNNTNYSAPDIDRGTGATNTTTIPLPLDANNQVITGIYTITMNTQINDGVNPVYYLSKVSTYSNTYSSPTVVITQTIDCITPRFTSTDATSYAVNGVTPTITRTHTIYYPTTPATSTSGSAATLTTGTFYNGVQQTTISSVLSYTFSDGLVINDTVTGYKVATVDCTFICSIYCCLRSLERRMMNNKGVNDVEYQKDRLLFAQIMGLVELTFLAVDCGKPNDITTYISEIRTLADCTEDCSCTDTQPYLVTGLGANSINVNVVSGGSPVTVTSNTVGSTTTYTITLSSAFVTKVNNSYNTVVAAGTGISVASATVGDTTTYTVTNTVTAKNFLSFQAAINYVSSPVGISITEQHVTLSGTTFDNTPNVDSVSSGTITWANLNNYFVVDSMFASAPVATSYKILATLTPVFIQGTLKTSTLGYYSPDGSGVSGNPNSFYKADKFFDIEILDQETSRFYFRIVRQSGSTMTNGYMAANNLQFIVHFMLIAL